MSLLPVYQDFSARLGHIGPVVAAGGAVRDHLRDRPHKDVDLFILNTELSPNVEAVKAALSDLELVNPLEFHLSEPYLCGTWRCGEDFVQVMCNPAATVDALLDTFDWNVCLFAYDGDFVAREEITNIGYGKVLRLQACRFPLSTLRRGFRFSERFRMVLPRETVRDLCASVLATGTGAEPDMPALAANSLIDEGDTDGNQE